MPRECDSTSKPFYTLAKSAAGLGLLILASFSACADSGPQMSPEEQVSRLLGSYQCDPTRNRRLVQDLYEGTNYTTEELDDVVKSRCKTSRIEIYKGSINFGLDDIEDGALQYRIVSQIDNRFVLELRDGQETLEMTIVAEDDGIYRVVRMIKIFYARR